METCPEIIKLSKIMETEGLPDALELYASLRLFSSLKHEKEKNGEIFVPKNPPFEWVSDLTNCADSLDSLEAVAPLHKKRLEVLKSAKDYVERCTFDFFCL